MKKTPLYESHIALGAKMVPFGGWEMPVQYPQGLIYEHQATRTACGLFDVSHMGEITIKGKGASDFLQAVTCNDLRLLEDGKAQYTALLNKQGGVIDDLIIYRYASDDYLLCVNASNTESCVLWVREQIKNYKDVVYEDVSSLWGQIAVQGPKAWGIINTLIGAELGLKYFRFKKINVKGVECVVARTGYTGEDGAEIFTPAESTAEIWNALIKLGGAPCGLGARDTLRLEAALPLHGHELMTDRIASSCGISWVIKLQKENFIGKEALVNTSPQQAIRGLELTAPGIARHGDSVIDTNTGEVVGVVTSGTRSPTLGKSIALAYVNTATKNCSVVVRGNKIPTAPCSLPFYKRKGV